MNTSFVALKAPQEMRWMALWLARLPTERVIRAGGAPSDVSPLALYAKSGNAFALSAVDARASEAGLREGMALADARAMRTDLVARPADDDADAVLLDSLAGWCERFTPIVALDPPHGLLLDISGCAHLFGGEAELRADVTTRLKGQGFAARAAIAPNPGAAWAFARFGETLIVEQAALAEALARLPIGALRLTPEATALLKRLGIRNIGQIMQAARAPFAARAGQNAMLRLDQALGRVPEALSPRRPPPPLFALRRLAEPIVTLDAILIVIETLCADLAAKLDRNGVGVNLLRLNLFGLDGKTRVLELSLSKPERNPKPMLRLLRERLRVATDNFDAAFGFEAIRLDAAEIARIVARASDLAQAAAGDSEAEARLIDTLTARLGAGRVGRLGMGDTHAPERVTVWTRAKHMASAATLPPADGVMRRPLRLFKRAHLIEAMASVPDGPPVRFRWRRVHHEIARAEGPERIMANWLRAPETRTRDYYRVEDTQGRRFWLYREGCYGEAKPPLWFLHGLFA